MDLYQAQADPNQKLDLIDILDFDEDACDETDLQRLFYNPYACVGHLLIAHKYTYILYLDSNGMESGGTFAAGLTDRSVMVYSVDQFTFLQKIQCQSLDIIGLKFSSVNPRLLFVGTKDKVTLWDLRTKAEQPVSIFIAFDVSLDDQVLCGGTEQRGENTFLLFWDVRQAQLEGGYWDSHGGDITQVQFHPRERDLLAVSSIEGLLNIFDVGEGSEDEALQMSLNTQDISVDKMMWCKTGDDPRCLCCLTHRETVQLWNIKDPMPLYTCSREDVMHAMQSQSFITGGEGGILNLWRSYDGVDVPPVIAFSEPEAFFHSASFHSSSTDPYRPVMPIQTNMYKMESDLKHRMKVRTYPYQSNPVPTSVSLPML